MKHFIKTERKQKEKSRKNQITFGNAEAVYSAAFSNCYSLYHHLRYASLWESMMKLDHRSLCSYNHCLHTTMFDGIIESLLHMAGDYVHFDRYCKYYKKRNNHRANIEVCMLAPWNNSYSTCTYEQSTGLTLTLLSSIETHPHEVWNAIHVLTNLTSSYRIIYPVTGDELSIFIQNETVPYPRSHPTKSVSEFKALLCSAVLVKDRPNFLPL